MKNKLTWREVFDTSKKNWGHIIIGRDGAIAAGYKYYCWNGVVLPVESLDNTNAICTTDDLVWNAKFNGDSQ